MDLKAPQHLWIQVPSRVEPLRFNLQRFFHSVSVAISWPIGDVELANASLDPRETSYMEKPRGRRQTRPSRDMKGTTETL